jgi:hypothetical protein
MKKILLGMAAFMLLAGCEKDVVDPIDDDDDNGSGSGTITHNGSTYESDLLLAYYPLNGNAFDAVGNLDGREEKVSYVEDRFGNPQSAARTPEGSYIDIADQQELDFTTDFSISVWAKSVPNASHRNWMGHIDIVGKWGGGDAYDSYMIGVTTDGMFEAWIDHEGSENRLTGGNTNAFDLNWHNLTLTFSGTDEIAKLYVNGILMDETNTGYPRNSGNNFRIGGRTDGYADFDGILDDVMIFNKELSAEEVAKLVF